MDHLALVVSQSKCNKMSPQNLANCFVFVYSIHWYIPYGPPGSSSLTVRMKQNVSTEPCYLFCFCLQHTLIYLMDHLALVVSQSESNKMSPQNPCYLFCFCLQHTLIYLMDQLTLVVSQSLFLFTAYIDIPYGPPGSSSLTAFVFVYSIHWYTLWTTWL